MGNRGRQKRSISNLVNGTIGDTLSIPIVHYPRNGVTFILCGRPLGAGAHCERAPGSHIDTVFHMLPSL